MMFFGLGLGADGRSRRLLAVRVALLVVLLVATYAFHISGTTLVELRIVRLVIFVALVVGVGWLARRRARGQLDAKADS